MKINKQYLFLLVLLCPFFLVSCSDDDDDNGNKAGDLSKAYSGDNLNATLNGEAISGKTITFQTNDLQTATVTLSSFFPGENEITVSNVQVTESNSGNYNFTGTDHNSFREIDITGTVGNNNLVINVGYKIISDLSGTWVPATEGPVTLRIVAAETATINLHGIVPDTYIIPLADFPPIFQELGTSIFSFLVNMEIEMKEDGQLIARWNPGPLANFQAGQSKDGMVQYNPMANRVIIDLAWDQLLANMDLSSMGGLGGGSISISEILALIETLAQGIQIPVEFNGTDNVQAVITKEFLAPYLDLLSPLLGSSLSNMDLGAAAGMGINNENLPAFAEEFFKAIKESDEFDIQINLQRKN
ncbi:MAG: DUF4925 domain-containing protein [Candidatus Azobacteroides sp.]|nr:DUF4925 domain-containing protein [Candidatus Azobacteroides sp.]